MTFAKHLPGFAGHVPLKVLLMFDQVFGAAPVAQALSLDAGSVYCCSQTFRLKRLNAYLTTKQSGYCGLLSSVQIAG